MFSFRSVSESEWPGISGTFFDLTFEQSLTYARAAAERIGATADFVVLEEGNRVVSAATVRIKTVPGLGRGIAWIPSGPLLYLKDNPPPDNAQIGDVLSTLRSEFCDRRGHILRVRPAGFAPLDEAVFSEIATAQGYALTPRAPTYTSTAIDLSQDEDVLMASLHGKWRGHLRYALKSELSLEIGSADELGERFLALYEDVRDTKDFRPEISPGFHFALDGPDYKYDILLATKDGQDLAGVVICSSGTIATYLFGATIPPGRKVRAGYFLTWEGIRRAQAEGLCWYDLGGIDQDTNPDVAGFKLRMNGSAIHSHAFEARPSGPLPVLVSKLEALRARAKGRQ